MITFLGTMVRNLRHQIIVAYFRFRGLEFSPGTMIDSGCRVQRGAARGQSGRIAAGPRLHCSQGVILDAHGGSIVLGSQVYLGPYTVIYGHGGVEIGDACLIAMHCRIVSSNHAVPPFSTDVRSQPDVLLPTKIGRDVWLGAGVTVLGGITIGDGSIVGAGAVVTNDLPAGSIAHGVPATIQGWREGSPRP